jgi:hypothetical protein
MPDTRTVAHDVQEQLVAAVHRGHKQLRKRQEQIRKSQEQLRKGREAVNVAIRTGNELAKAVRPNIPARPGKGLQLPPFSTLPSPAKLRAQAQEFAGQVAATQRNLADKALHVAGPLVVDGVARLNQVAKSFLEEHDHGHATVAAEPEAKPVADEVKPAADEAATPKAATAKTGTAKTSAAKTSTAKSGTKTSTAKTSTAKADGSAKTSTAKAKN